ncbi:MAG: PEP-CTERM sorting domain-containing protein, partial [Verrucomicrobia subdivision 3 bacterium]|nr:PEP-CTERM sorting domain-containing protein [Limisphaerales bacterium]
VPVDNAGGMGGPAAPGDATWLHRFAFSDFWAAPGGAPGIDFNPTYSSAALIFGLDSYQFEGTLDMINDVQSWLDNPGTNFGWMLMTSSEELPFTGRRFASREDPNGAGPLLFVEYEPIPEPATWALIAVGAAVLFRRLRLR